MFRLKESLKCLPADIPVRGLAAELNFMKSRLLASLGTATNTILSAHC